MNTIGGFDESGSYSLAFFPNIFFKGFLDINGSENAFWDSEQILREILGIIFGVDSRAIFRSEE